MQLETMTRDEEVRSLARRLEEAEAFDDLLSAASMVYYGGINASADDWQRLDRALERARRARGEDD